MAGESLVTTDHDTIRKWAEKRGGHPATIAGTERSGEDAGILRIDFPDYGDGDRLEQIEWDDFFAKFDESELAFVYQEKTSDGDLSRFGKFVSRDSV